MAEFFRRSTTWVVDYRYEGRPRRWFKAFPEGLDPAKQVRAELRALYGDHAQVVQVRVATCEEESQYLRGNQEQNFYCPTARRPGSRR